MYTRSLGCFFMLALLGSALPSVAADQSANGGASSNEELTWCGCSASDTNYRDWRKKGGRYWWSKAFQVAEDQCDEELLMPAFYQAIEAQYATKVKSDVSGQCFTYSSRKYLLDRHKSAMSGMHSLSPKMQIGWVEFSPQ